jgi:hypothetical protein
MPTGSATPLTGGRAIEQRDTVRRHCRDLGRRAHPSVATTGDILRVLRGCDHARRGQRGTRDLVVGFGCGRAVGCVTFFVTSGVAFRGTSGTGPGLGSSRASAGPGAGSRAHPCHRRAQAPARHADRAGDRRRSASRHEARGLVGNPAAFGHAHRLSRPAPRGLPRGRRASLDRRLHGTGTRHDYSSARRSYGSYRCYPGCRSGHGYCPGCSPGCCPASRCRDHRHYGPGQRRALRPDQRCQAPRRRGLTQFLYVPVLVGSCSCGFALL